MLHCFRSPATWALLRHRLSLGNALRTGQRVNAELCLSNTAAEATIPAATALNTAAALGDLKGAKKLVSEGCDVNLHDYDGRTPLHVAASFNNLEMTSWLVEQGALLTEDRESRLPINDSLHHQNESLTEILKTCKYEHDHDFTDTLDPQLVTYVFEQVARHGLFTVKSLKKKLRYYVNDLGWEEDYFKTFSPQEIAEQFHSFTAACISARTSRNAENICVESTNDTEMVILFTDCNKLSVQSKAEKYMMATPKGMGVNLQCMRSRNSAVKDGTQTLSVYRIRRSPYCDGTRVGDEDATISDSFSAAETASEAFLSQTNDELVQRFDGLLKASAGKPYAIMQDFDAGHGLTDVMFAVPTGTVANDQVFLQSVSDTFQRLGFHTQGGRIDKFSNGTAVYTIRSAGLQKGSVRDNELLATVKSYANLAFTQFRSPLFEAYTRGEMSGRQLLYFHAACRFAHYFEYRKNEDLDDLYNHFKDKPSMLDRVSSLDKSLGTNLNTLNELYTCVESNPEVAEQLYIHFARKMTGDMDGYHYPDVNLLTKTVSDPGHQHILKTFLLFNESVTSTNLWKSSKSAAAFRMDPSVFLKNHYLPEIPFAIFMVLGLDFTGFHVRFRDISRGGVRVIKSTLENYPSNRQSQFLENFNLAYTQKLKNKDIPESGSKGTILLKQNKNDRSSLAFSQYIDAILDITLKADGVIDLYKEDEYIFLGPDENTAGYMDGACEYARGRGYQFWRAFTTGKGPALGGIPHDTHGMTTRSVRSFSKGIIRRLGLDETKVTKFMTGGPDGDLGSNEILMGKERVVGVVDGSGVLFDPEGINDVALKELAAQRQMVSHFDQGKLGPQGFFIDVDGPAHDTLPGWDGVTIRNVADFRDNFHVWDHLQADFFVPCGGRPESIHKGNVDKIIMPNGEPRFKYIVEGANLFITESARNFLQDKNVLLFKDASTNKGGVTSSSLEVLAGLSMTDDEFAEHMQAHPNGDVPEFYAQYVQQVVETVETNATLEFDYIYDEMRKTGRRSTEITRNLSEEMNNLNDMITQSDLFDSEPLRRVVLKQSIPSVLQNKVGLDNIMQRVPLAYQRAIFAMYATFLILFLFYVFT
jgi:glutamate dehydrogenase